VTQGALAPARGFLRVEALVSSHPAHPALADGAAVLLSSIPGK
jgi:hypothetical protein